MFVMGPLLASYRIGRKIAEFLAILALGLMEKPWLSVVNYLSFCI